MQSAYTDMYDAMQAYYNQTAPEAGAGKSGFGVENVCAARVYGKWLRVRVIGLGNRRNVYLLDVDKADSACAEDMRPLLPKFADFREKLIWKCSLHGVRPTSGNWGGQAVRL